MKRSEINKIMSDAVKFIDYMKFIFPPYAFWNVKDWHMKGKEYDEIRENMLGWDITDFGSGEFYKIGLLMFTLRNGSFENKKYKKPYAEKVLIVEEEQITPLHFHWNKMEDVINRGGGNLLVQLYNSTDNGELDSTPVKISIDGRNYEVESGAVVRLTPGESITLETGQYHKFWGEKETGKRLLGEVSKVNDDRVDNRFYDEVGRFPEIEEDEEALYLLSNEYPEWCGEYIKNI